MSRLKEAGHEVTLYFSNSNLDTADEFEKRRAAAETLAAAEGVALIIDPYDHAAWLKEAAAGFEDAPEKGARCTRCFRFNLTRTAVYATDHGYDAWTTSLTVSPHKVSAVIFEVGREVVKELSKLRNLEIPQFLEEDFKKREGFKLSRTRSAELNLYCQAYCGCEFAKRQLKDNLRQSLRAKRRALDAETKAAADARICSALLARVAEVPGVVAVYLASPAEIDLTAFIRDLLAHGRTLVAPRWNGETYELAQVKSLDDDDLQTGPMNIREPRVANLVAPAEVAVWIVPGLAFTMDGRRLGYGGGWYDRLLAEASSESLKLGVAYDFQIVRDVPSEPHDKVLTAVVSDASAV